MSRISFTEKCSNWNTLSVLCFFGKNGQGLRIPARAGASAAVSLWDAGETYSDVGYFARFFSTLSRIRLSAQHPRVKGLIIVADHT
jgi:hypothetical protein